MATIVYKRARLFLGEADISAQLTELNVEYSVEILDDTRFGHDTRFHKGGLSVANISGKGSFDDALGPLGAESLLWNYHGADDTVCTVFANGITEGDFSSGGFAMKGVVTEFNFGDGGVGAILGLTFNIQGRGLVF